MKSLYGRDMRQEILTTHVGDWTPLQVLRLTELQHANRITEVFRLPEYVSKKPAPPVPVQAGRRRKGTKTPAMPPASTASTASVGTMVCLSAGFGGHCLFVVGKRAFAFGLGEDGQLGLKTIPKSRPASGAGRGSSAKTTLADTGGFHFVSSPAIIDTLLGTGVVQMSAGVHHSIAVTLSGDVYSW